ncbi:MAG: MFS transporter [Victivallales bacterium]|nr:MFS transporter [Victivallales bacterium]
MSNRSFCTSSAFRLGALASSHLVVDMFGSILPGIVPAALEHFQIDLGMGIYVMTTIAVGCNLLQIPVARLDRSKRTPRLLILGAFLAGMIMLLGYLPRTTPTILLCLLMLVVSTGVALVHPFGLRGVQNLSDISTTISTPSFMTGGFLGASLGPLLAAVLVTHFGLRGLLWLAIPLALLLLALFAARIELAPDSGPATATPGKPSQTGPASPWGFVGLMLIAIFINTGSTIINQLMPTTLQTVHDFSSTFGGASLTLFGAGSAIGSMTIGYLAKKYPPKWFVIGGMLIGVPSTILYFLCMGHAWACVLVFFAGLTVSSGYPLLVALARNVNDGPALSTRLALLVGGSWGIAGLAFLGIGQLAHHCIGLGAAMHTAWICYALALLSAIFLCQPSSVPRH